MPVPIMASGFKYNVDRSLCPFSFMVDLNGTLITRAEDSGPERVSVHGKTYRFGIRRGAKEFVTRLLSNGSVYLCTTGTRAYAKSILSKTGMRDMFDDNLVTRESFRMSMFPEIRSQYCIFIDDEDGHAKAISMFSGRLSHKPPHIYTVGVQPYRGDEDDGLDSAVPKIAAIMENHGLEFI